MIEFEAFIVGLCFGCMVGVCLGYALWGGE